MNDESRPVKAAPVSTGVPARTGAEHTAPATDASRRRDRIKLLLSAMTTTTEKIAELLDAAQADEDHRILVMHPGPRMSRVSTRIPSLGSAPPPVGPRWSPLRKLGCPHGLSPRSLVSGSPPLVEIFR